MTTTDRRYATAFDALELAPDLVEHIATLITMKSKGGSEVRTSPVHAPAPLNIDALDTVDRIMERLSRWADHWTTALGVPGPETTAPIHSPAAEPTKARDAALSKTKWLLLHLDEIFRRNPDDVITFTDELTEVHRAALRYPMLHQPRYTDVRCRVLGCNGPVALWPFTDVKKWAAKDGIVFLPPEGARVLCDECGDRWTESDYREEVDRRVTIIKEQQKADQVSRRLMKKYGPASQFPLFFGSVAGKVRHGSNQKMASDTMKDLTTEPENPVG